MLLLAETLLPASSTETNLDAVPLMSTRRRKEQTPRRQTKERWAGRLSFWGMLRICSKLLSLSPDYVEDLCWQADGAVISHTTSQSKA
jgi:hypothetical protein